MISIKIKDTLFTFRTRLVNILVFNPKKLSIPKVCTINDEIESIYYFKYDEDPFYLVIDDLKGFFKFLKKKELKFIIEDQSKRKIYDQIWDIIKELIDNVCCVGFRFYDYSKDCNVIRFDTDDSLPLNTIVSVYSMTIVIRSVYRTCLDRFYPQIYLKNCIYKTVILLFLIFLKALILKNVKKHLKNVIYVNFIIF